MGRTSYLCDTLCSLWPGIIFLINSHFWSLLSHRLWIFISHVITTISLFFSSLCSASRICQMDWKELPWPVIQIEPTSWNPLVCLLPHSPTSHLLYALFLEVCLLVSPWNTFPPNPSNHLWLIPSFLPGVSSLCSNIAVPHYCEWLVNISIIIIKPPLSLFSKPQRT